MRKNSAEKNVSETLLNHVRKRLIRSDCQAPSRCAGIGSAAPSELHNKASWWVVRVSTPAHKPLALQLFPHWKPEKEFSTKLLNPAVVAGSLHERMTCC